MYHRFIAWRDGAVLRRHYARSPSGDMLAEVPDLLLSYWKRTAAAEFPGLPRNTGFYVRALEGLLEFFDCVGIARASCELPSRAADSVWHAWLACDPAGLERFCLRHYGRAIPHHPAGTMQGEPDMALAACLVAARRRQGLPAAGPRLPLLFKLDEALRMPLGMSHSLAHGRVCCGRLDRLGHPSDSRRYPERLTPNGLLLAGLVSEEEAAFSLRQPGWNGLECDPAYLPIGFSDFDGDSGRDDDRKRGGCGAGYGGGGDAGDVCADAGGDGGGGCGGGCGGD